MLPAERALPVCRFRPFAEADFEACAEIYRLNAPGRFPEGYFEDFREWLRGDRNLVLVAEVKGEIRAVGGIGQSRNWQYDVASLNFGMVHPNHHRQGYGTASLLARLALLPPPAHRWIATLTTTGGSESFYKRFGFVPQRRFADGRGNEFDQYVTFLHTRDGKACRTLLAAAGITMDTDGVAVPSILPPDAPSEPEEAPPRS